MTNSPLGLTLFNQHSIRENVTFACDIFFLSTNDISCNVLWKCVVRNKCIFPWKEPVLGCYKYVEFINKIELYEPLYVLLVFGSRVCIWISYYHFWHCWSGVWEDGRFLGKWVIKCKYNVHFQFKFPYHCNTIWKDMHRHRQM
jgi:hypothetical protein